MDPLPTRQADAEVKVKVVRSHVNLMQIYLRLLTAFGTLCAVLEPCIGNRLHLY